jgi:uncharacterized protein YigA (DUF484 family)
MSADHPLFATASSQPEHVAAYLRANPGFLAARPELFAVLHPPARVHGANLADHMVAMVRAARAHAASSDAESARVLAAGRASSCIAERVQTAVLAALHATDIIDCVIETWPGLLGVDAAALCCEDGRPRWRSLPVGAVKSLLRNRPMVFRDRPADASLLHAEAALLAERDLLVHLPGERPALLALVSRDPACLPNTQAWVFLGQVLSALVDKAQGRSRSEPIPRSPAAS